MAAGEAYSSNDVARAAAITLRQLQWWDERNVVSPAEKGGHRRLYTFEEVIAIAVIAELRRKGLPLQKIRPVIRYLKRELGRNLEEAPEHKQDLYLLTDGQCIHLSFSKDKVIDLLLKAQDPMFLVSVSEQVRRLETVAGGPECREQAK